jgi:hypothetical protein
MLPKRQERSEWRAAVRDAEVHGQRKQASRVIGSRATHARAVHVPSVHACFHSALSHLDRTR